MTTIVETPVSSSLDIRPLQPTIGAEISGVNIAEPLTPAVRDEIRAALLRHKVVFFRDQELTQQTHEAFAREFGPLYTHPGAAKAEATSGAIHRISADDLKKYERTFRPQPGDDTWDAYHTDTSWRLVPTWGAVLRAVVLPEVGGDTVWVDAALAYESLSDEIKERLEGRHVTHDYRSALQVSGHDYPIVAHPVVRTHRETGKRNVWVNFTQRPTIVGLDRSESRELLAAIIDQYRRPENQVRFSWRPGSVAFWDNRATVHYAVRNYGSTPRLLERILIADDPQYADL